MAHFPGRSSLAGVAERLTAHRRGPCNFGVYSVCSSHPQVLAATLQFAADRNTPAMIESTCNQVNHQGGYTGMRPHDFVARVERLAQEHGQPRIILGGDHLGPYPWRHLPADQAMQQAVDMVSAYVDAGYQKIHIDTTMPCADDARPLALTQIVERTEALCRVAERTAASVASRPYYILGSEVPTPGGEGEGHGLSVTSSEELQRTVAAFQQQLEYLWPRVLGFVVQPGVEFYPHHIHPYCRQHAAPLSLALGALSGLWVFEAHSTDYQSEAALQALVEDHFAILKVGPELTSAYREALFALAQMEKELYQAGRLTQHSHFREQLIKILFADDQHWREQYHGSKKELRFSLEFALSDRIRYYWEQPEVMALVDTLLRQLQEVDIPPGLRSQYFPGSQTQQPAQLIQQRITKVLARYHRACGGGAKP